jgi:acetyl-CoA carboxylase carboxyl transferase subunit alpha
MARLDTAVIAVVIGEGGSGGALAMGVANVVLMMENSIYSVISPESCSTIIYRDRARAEQAAAALKLTAQDLLGLELIDGIVPEPPGGAQENADASAANLRAQLLLSLDQLAPMNPAELVEHRYAKFRKMGNFFA